MTEDEIAADILADVMTIDSTYSPVDLDANWALETGSHRRRGW